MVSPFHSKNVLGRFRDDIIVTDEPQVQEKWRPLGRVRTHLLEGNRSACKTVIWSPKLIWSLRKTLHYGAHDNIPTVTHRQLGIRPITDHTILAGLELWYVAGSKVSQPLCTPPTNRQSGSSVVATYSQDVLMFWGFLLFEKKALITVKFLLCFVFFWLGDLTHLPSDRAYISLGLSLINFAKLGLLLT